MSLKANGSVVVTQIRNGGADVDVHKTLLSAVVDILDNGAIGDGCHGDAAHRAALVAVVKRAQEVIAKIDKPDPRTCNRHHDCDAVDAQAKASGKRGPDHCHLDDCDECFGS